MNPPEIYQNDNSKSNSEDRLYNINEELTRLRHEACEKEHVILNLNQEIAIMKNRFQ